MARIIHPRPEIGRQVAFEIEFVDGVGERDLTDAPNLTAALIQHGYVIEADLDYLGDWTKQKLVTYASEQGIDLTGAKTKPQILAAIEAQALDAIVVDAEASHAAITSELEAAGLSPEAAIAAAPGTHALSNGASTTAAPDSDAA